MHPPRRPGRLDSGAAATARWCGSGRQDRPRRPAQVPAHWAGLHGSRVWRLPRRCHARGLLHDAIRRCGID